MFIYLNIYEHMSTIKYDLEYGFRREKILMPFLEEEYGLNLEKTGQFYAFDFEDREAKVLIELKSRRNKMKKYPNTMISFNKVLEGMRRIKEGYRMYFVFEYTDCICSYQLKIGGIKTEWIEMFNNREYLFLPIEQLEIIKKK